MRPFPAFLVDRDLEVRTGLFHEEGCIFEEKPCMGKEIKRIIMPSLFNSHVHLMDSLTLSPRMPLEKLVGPGGYKFRVLSSATIEELVKASKQAILHALANGTTGLADFREMGWKGLNVLKRADADAVIPMARPETVEEAESISEDGFARGFGMSSTRDHDTSFLEELREVARRSGLLFAIHAGEKDDGDVEAALALEPDFIVHMNRASEKNLRRLVEAEIPVISCIRSNFFFGLENLKNYSFLAEYENWGLGTDNAMIATPSVLDEINFASYFIASENLFKASFFGFNFFNVRQKWILLESTTSISNPIEHAGRGFCRTKRIFESIEVE